MSLINDMLRDLERRPPPRWGKFAGLHHATRDFTHQYQRQQRYYQTLGFFIFVLIMALTCWLAHLQQQKRDQQALAAHPVAKQAAALTSAAGATSAPNTPLALAPVKPTAQALAPATTPATMPVTAAIPPTLTPIQVEPAEQQYQHAIALVNTQHEQDAIILLHGLLIEYPEHTKGREYLAALLLHQNATMEAEKVVTTGLTLHPDYPPFVKLAARLMMERGEFHQAIALLENKPPTIEEYPDYHALLAALYQRADQAPAAAALYKQLLALEPDNAKWWVGLGVALDTVGDKTQAFEAFSTAKGIGGLSPALTDYLESRLTTLT